MPDVESTGKKAFPTTQIIVNAFHAAFGALIISLIAFTALTDRSVPEALKVALQIAAGTIFVTILVQTVIHLMMGRD